MLPFQEMENFPSRCPHSDCRAKIFQDCILGVAPRPEVPLVNVVLRCKKCRKTSGFGMPAVVVHKFIESLPEGDGLLANRRVDPKKNTSRISEKEVQELSDLISKNPKRLITELRVSNDDDVFGQYDDKL